MTIYPILRAIINALYYLAIGDCETALKAIEQAREDLDELTSEDEP